MIHYLSHIREGIYHAHQLETSVDSGIVIEKKIKYFYTGKKNNNGGIFEVLEEIMPGIYEKVDCEADAYIANNNRLPSIAWYIDSDPEFVVKENIPASSSYAITEKDYRQGDLWISKPSHRFFGSGKLIKIGTKSQVSNRREKFKGELLNFIVQPLISNIRLWFDTFKFDLRMFAVVYNIENTFKAAYYKYGICRRCVHPYNPAKDPNSAITNVSIQEKIHGYDSEFHMPLVYDDTDMGIEVLKDLLSKVRFRRDPRKNIQFLILGLDIIILDDGSFRLIEINDGPYVETCKANNERIASLGFILGAFGNLVPWLLKRKQKLARMPDWDFV